MNTGTVLILGANGRFGRCAVKAFAAAGWQVIAQVRSAARGELPAGVRVVQCGIDDPDALLHACAARPDIVINALNPLYTEWETAALPLAESALAVARAAGALLMLPGNVYNFGRALPRQLTEDTPQRADTSKAAIRIDIERRMQSAAATGTRCVVIRAGDFLGGPGPGTWVDLVIAKHLRRERLTWPGALDVEHSWAYVPDLARVFVAVAQRRAELAPFEVLHYRGLSLSAREFHQAFERVLGKPLGSAHFPWWLLRLAAPFSPMMRALLEMRYLWERPHRLEQSRLHALLGKIPETGLDEVVRDVLVNLSGAGVAAGSQRAEEGTVLQ